VPALSIVRRKKRSGNGSLSRFERSNYAPITARRSRALFTYRKKDAGGWRRGSGSGEILVARRDRRNETQIFGRCSDDTAPIKNSLPEYHTAGTSINCTRPGRFERPHALVIKFVRTGPESDRRVYLYYGSGAVRNRAPVTVRAVRAAFSE